VLQSKAKIKKAEMQHREWVTSACKEYTTDKPAETPALIAKKFAVDVADVLFVNRDRHAALEPSTKLPKGAVLRIPHFQEEPARWSAPSLAPRTSDKSRTRVRTRARTHTLRRLRYRTVAADTPATVAAKFSLTVKQLIDANKHAFDNLRLGLLHSAAAQHSAPCCDPQWSRLAVPVSVLVVH
jgi:LysM repeat protein